MNQLMLRLIKDGKIVGYLKIEPNNISCWGEDECMLNETKPHDSFDLGIKVGDEWWFSGDTGEHPSYGKFTLNYDILSGFTMVMESDVFKYARVQPTMELLGESKIIGNTYEQEKL